MARHMLSKKDMKNFEKNMENFGLWANFLEKAQIEVEEKKGRKCFSVGNVIIAVENDILLPSVELLNAVKPVKNVIEVDRGAVPHIMNGSNLFIKGVTALDGNIEKDSIVYIMGPDRRFIAVGRSQASYGELKEMKEGIAATTLLVGGKDPCQM
jgi:PUA domain protein